MTAQDALRNVAEAIVEVRATYREHLILQESLATLHEFIKQSTKKPESVEPAESPNERKQQ
jgi:hypothetical protein